MWPWRVFIIQQKNMSLSTSDACCYSKLAECNVERCCTKRVDSALWIGLFPIYDSVIHDTKVFYLSVFCAPLRRFAFRVKIDCVVRIATRPFSSRLHFSQSLTQSVRPSVFRSIPSVLSRSPPNHWVELTTHSKNWHRCNHRRCKVSRVWYCSRRPFVPSDNTHNNGSFIIVIQASNGPTAPDLYYRKVNMKKQILHKLALCTWLKLPGSYVILGIIFIYIFLRYFSYILSYN